mmetsp:Transcript_14794/g.46498  ORF Transcript_14794/g.46498 Transcript_14794/m.46498 type:complete len:449 (+) Transcript_14794:439-1785(+)
MSSRDGQEIPRLRRQCHGRGALLRLPRAARQRRRSRRQARAAPELRPHLPRRMHSALDRRRLLHGGCDAVVALRPPHRSLPPVPSLRPDHASAPQGGLRDRLRGGPQSLSLPTSHPPFCSGARERRETPSYRSLMSHRSGLAGRTTPPRDLPLLLRQCEGIWQYDPGSVRPSTLCAPFGWFSRRTLHLSLPVDKRIQDLLAAAALEAGLFDGVLGGRHVGGAVVGLRRRRRGVGAEDVGRDVAVVSEEAEGLGADGGEEVEIVAEHGAAEAGEEVDGRGVEGRSEGAGGGEVRKSREGGRGGVDEIGRVGGAVGGAGHEEASEVGVGETALPVVAAAEVEDDEALGEAGRDAVPGVAEGVEVDRGEGAAAGAGGGLESGDEGGEGLLREAVVVLEKVADPVRVGGDVDAEVGGEPGKGGRFLGALLFSGGGEGTHEASRSRQEAASGS